MTGYQLSLVACSPGPVLGRRPLLHGTCPSLQLPAAQRRPLKRFHTAGPTASTPRQPAPHSPVGGKQPAPVQPTSEPKRCSHCGSDHSHGKWERQKDTRQLLCSACASYVRKSDGRLPPPEVLRRRGQREVEKEQQGMACSHRSTAHSSAWHWHKGQRLCAACDQALRDSGRLPSLATLQRRQQFPRGTKEEIAQRRCLQCGARSPGTRVKACWRRHPVTREGWYCERCYDSVRRRIKNEQQRTQP